MRWHLFPEIRVSQGTFDLGSPSAPKVETVPDIVRVMDLQQEQLARSMGEGHRVIHGVAGSGETMILGYCALQCQPAGQARVGKGMSDFPAAGRD